MEDSNNTGKIIGALLIGAALGATLGILFAPDKGSVTRRKIAGKTSDLAESLKEKFDALMEEARKEIDLAKEKASELAGHSPSK
ncbi:MAG TPA: YtxH domain-containing protein [Bacteroidia bacterium]|nr:YtxH domain-containing protein [Bacteroidia bacterium]